MACSTKMCVWERECVCVCLCLCVCVSKCVCIQTYSNKYVVVHLQSHLLRKQIIFFLLKSWKTSLFQLKTLENYLILYELKITEKNVLITAVRCDCKWCDTKRCNTKRCDTKQCDSKRTFSVPSNCIESYWWCLMGVGTSPILLSLIFYPNISLFYLLYKYLLFIFISRFDKVLTLQTILWLSQWCF